MEVGVFVFVTRVGRTGPALQALCYMGVILCYLLHVEKGGVRCYCYTLKGDPNRVFFVPKCYSGVKY